MFSMHSDKLGLYWGNNGTPFMFFRFFLIIILMAAVTLICSDYLDFVEKFVPPSAIIITGLMIFDYFVTQFSGGQFLYRVWWIAYIITTLMTVFMTVTLLKYENYQRFYKRFWLSFTPVYLFLLYLCFLRTPGESHSVNLVIGQGSFLMLKALINNIHVSFEAPLMFFGNLIVFTPLPFILSAVSKKFNPVIIMIIGIIIPYAVEGYQYFFNCGQVDIDDVVLNFAGFYLAFIVYAVIYKRILNKKDTD